ncbi:conjugal transfer protein TrbI, partial [Salmonella enterica]|nr:conjugal transfer protein TrbI [Salmonella enterica]
MAEQDKMSPDASPGVANKTGVRRVNKRPMYIAIGGFALFCILVAYIANKRANQSMSNTAETTIQRGSSRDTSAMAMDVMGGSTSGIIEAPTAPSEIPTQDNKTQQSTNYTSVPIAPVADPDQPPVPPQSVTSRSNDPEADQIRRNKMRDFIEAVKAKTEVNLPNQLGRSSTTGNTPQTRDEMLQEIANVRRQMEQNNAGDATASYDAQVQRIRASMNGVTDSNSDTGMQLASVGGVSVSHNDINQFGKKGQGDRWLLDEQISAPHSQYELRAGWVIPGVMISGINSDLPGQIIGQVAQDVYDSATGKYLLIPHGTRVIGTYSS